ncbi:DEAD/DEAH box helicase family protein, partial [Chromatium okenii]|uniref:DEAD/DEAH box helicase family protein n=1 Tax=Chromatium okenii TaxID=61644 RepID=UPI0026EED44C
YEADKVSKLKRPYNEIAEFNAALEALALDDNPLPRAIAIAVNSSWRCPQLTTEELTLLIADAIPSRSDAQNSENIINEIRRYVESAHQDDLNQYLNLTKLTPDIEVNSNEEAQCIIDDAGAGHFAVCSGIGTGKTTKIMKPLTDKIERSNVIVNSVALASAACKVLDGFIPYHDLPSDGSIVPQRIVTTPDSSTKEYAGALDNCDLLVIDEAHHVTDAIFGGRMGKKAKSVLDATVRRVDKAPLSVIMDANLNDLDISLFGSKPVVIRVTEARRIPFTTKIIRSMQTIEVELTAALAENETVLFCSNSEKIAFAQFKKACKAFPNKLFAFIGAKKGRATTGDGHIKALTEEINTECVKYAGIFHSPAITTGLSITVEHFTKHFAIFTSSASHETATQMTGRDRTAIHWTIALIGNGRNAAPATPAERNAELIARYHLNCVTQGIEPSQSLSSFAMQKNLRAGANDLLKRNWMQSICFAFERDSVRVEYDNTPDTKEYRQVCEDFQQELDVEFASDLAKSPTIDPHDITNWSQHEQVISAALEATEITDFFGVSKEQITAPLVQIWNDGRIKNQLEAFKMIDGNADIKVDKDKTDLSLATFGAAKQAGIQAFKAASGGLLKGEIAVTADEVLELYDKLKVDPAAAGVGMVWNLRRKPSKQGAIRWLNVGLGHAGQWVHREGASAQRRYRVQRGVKTTRAGKVIMPGLDVMQALATAKEDTSLIDIGT